MNSRSCVCGARISFKRSLCDECLEVYGADRKSWPEWVRFMVGDIEKEVKKARSHDELELFEDGPASEAPSWEFTEAYANLRRAESNPEMDFEDFIWSNV